ncbi:unnamed protein product [marine sediment metagenome]|uniref:CobQ/CobB/MinD/ParA nucleotide binding domain-containing protein n=1 Tax=marine sediment metagenome TaxID=412755 RepID=X1TKT5_9ZZZZ
MKLAITGKGGTGKTTFAAVLSRRFAESGYSVIAFDADPDANLASTLGFPDAENIVPLVEMKELITERMGAVPGQTGQYFRLNPRVDDIPEKYSLSHNGIRLLVMGTVTKGGGGCACPENTFLRELLTHLFTAEKDIVIMDMVAGVEHLGRGTATAMDMLLVVVEPNQRSIETAIRIKKLASDIGISDIRVVANKIRNDEERAFIEKKHRPA